MNDKLNKVVLVICLICLPALSRAATFVVTSTASSGPGTLRQGILDANATPGYDTIVFQLPGSPPYLITPVAPLPTISDPVLIDGRTQPGYKAHQSSRLTAQ